MLARAFGSPSSAAAAAAAATSQPPSANANANATVGLALDEIAKLTTALGELERRAKSLEAQVQARDAQILAIMNKTAGALSAATFRKTPLTQADRVVKDECVLSFATPLAPGGLYVNLDTLLAYSRAEVAGDWSRTGRTSAYLVERFVEVAAPSPSSQAQQQQQPASLAGATPDKEKENAPKKLAIGVEGGFARGRQLKVDGGMEHVYASQSSRDVVADRGRFGSGRVDPRDYRYGAQVYSSEGDIAAGLQATDGHETLGYGSDTGNPVFPHATKGHGYFSEGTEALHNTAAAALDESGLINEGATANVPPVRYRPMR